MIDVRPASAKDFVSLYALAEKVSELRVSKQHAFMDPEEFKMSMASQDSVFLVGEVDGSLAGFIYADANDPEKRGAEKKWACLVYLAVTERYRRHGVANALYAQCIVELLQRGVTHVYGWAGLSPEITTFLKARGFEAGRHCVWMDKALTPSVRPDNPEPFDLTRFAEQQAGRDHEAERRAYVATCDVFLYDGKRKLVVRQPLSALPDFPRELPSVVLWKSRHYRLGAAIGGGGVKRSTIQFDEIVNEQDRLKSWDRVFAIETSEP